MADEIEAKIQEALEKQKQELQAKFEEDTKGLKSTVEALKAEKLKDREKAQAEIEAKEQEAIEAAKKAGEHAKALELEKAQFERQQAKLKEDLEARNNLILTSKKEAAIKGITSHFAKQDKFAQLTASQLVDYGFDDDGNVTANYKDLDGNVVADSHEKWLEWAKSDADMQEHLAGSQASGADVSRVKPVSGSRGAQTYKDMTPDQKREYLKTIQVERH